jgi:hypothetical protein
LRRGVGVRGLLRGWLMGWNDIGHASMQRLTTGSSHCTDFALDRTNQEQTYTLIYVEVAPRRSNFLRAISYVATLLIGALGVYLMFAVGALDGIDGRPGTYSEPELSLPTYLSFIAVMLTTVTVVLAAVAIGIGIVAYYTYTGLKQEAKHIATSTALETAGLTAKSVADEALAEVKIKAMVLELYAKAEKDREQKEEWGEEPDENQDR